VDSKVRNMRLRLKWSKYRLAKEMGVSWNTVHLDSAQVKALKGRAVLCVTGNNVPKILVANKDIKLEIFQEVK